MVIPSLGHGERKGITFEHTSRASTMKALKQYAFRRLLCLMDLTWKLVLKTLHQCGQLVWDELAKNVLYRGSSILCWIDEVHLYTTILSLHVEERGNGWGLVVFPYLTYQQGEMVWNYFIVGKQLCLDQLTLEMASKTVNQSSTFQMEQIGLQPCRGFVFSRAHASTMSLHIRHEPKAKGNYCIQAYFSCIQDIAMKQYTM